RAGSYESALADLGTVHDDGADSDQRPVADVAAVQDDAVADSDAVADDGREAARVDVDHRVVLDVGVRADADLLDVAAHDRSVPDAGPRAEDDVADHGGALRHPGPGPELRRLSAEGLDHAFSLLPGAGGAPDASPAGASATLRIRSASPLLTFSSASA